MKKIKVGDRFKPKQEMFRTEITVININEFRDPEEKYGCFLKRWYGGYAVEEDDEVYFFSEDFLTDCCERINE